MKEYLTHKEIINKISEKHKIPTRKINYIVTAFFAGLLVHLEYYRELNIRGFGKFIRSKKATLMNKRKIKHRQLRKRTMELNYYRKTSV